MAEKLKSCPFCGSKSDLIYPKEIPTVRFGKRVFGDEAWKVFYCRKCGAEGPMSKEYEESGKLWNGRYVEKILCLKSKKTGNSKR